MYERDTIIRRATQLSVALQNLDVIENYRDIETQIHQHPQIATYMTDLKQNQKQSVNLQNYDKPVAYRRSEAKIAEVQSHIDAFPIVSQFRQSQEEANDVLHLVIDTLARRLQGDHHFSVSSQHNEE